MHKPSLPRPPADPRSRPPVSLCDGALANDLREIRERGVLRHLGVPYANFVTGSGDGLDVEIVQLFAKHSACATSSCPAPGKRHRRPHRQGDPLQAHRPGSRPRQIRGDMIANGMTILPPRLKVLDFSDPTFPSAVWLLARPDVPAQPIKPSGDREQDIKATKARKLGTTFVMDNSCLDPTLYDLENKGLKLKRFTGSTNINDVVPAMLKRERHDAARRARRAGGPRTVAGPDQGDRPDLRRTAHGRRLPQGFPELRKPSTFLAGIKADGTYMRW
jgi:hypothetical protein